MAKRERLSLPDGYRATQIAGAWYLFDPWDVFLAGPADAASVQRHAWCDVWRRMDQELNDEIAAFRDGTRPLQDLPRLRRFFLMWDGVAKGGPESDQRSNAARPARPRPSTMVAGAVLVALVVAALGTGPGPHGPAARTIERKHAVSASPATQNDPLPAPPRANVSGVARSLATAGMPAATSWVRRPPRAAYVVILGRFKSPTAAEKMKHLVQRKGYVVRVVPHGAVSAVMTPPLRTRTQAEHVLRGLEAVGLQARVMAWGEQ